MIGLSFQEKTVRLFIEVDSLAGNNCKQFIVENGVLTVIRSSNHQHPPSSTRFDSSESAWWLRLVIVFRVLIKVGDW